ncbi:type IIL restriction-modification enzyme MmeI [Brevundimonas balnearis]|uniref:Type IIL restriction-modification enzyme MmeI n=1 Tax=Brevundimonas balnearis TaxID=1572858 RepID=A0ABV6R0S3_9CAUL
MVEAFIQAWTSAPLRERSHCHSFIIQLCRVIGVPAPDEDQPGDLDYAFERAVQFRHDDGTVSHRRMDCYRRGAFVLEAKQSGAAPQSDQPAAGRFGTGATSPTDPAI